MVTSTLFPSEVHKRELAGRAPISVVQCRNLVSGERRRQDPRSMVLRTSQTCAKGMTAWRRPNHSDLHWNLRRLQLAWLAAVCPARYSNEVLFRIITLHLWRSASRMCVYVKFMLNFQKFLWWRMLVCRLRKHEPYYCDYLDPVQWSTAAKRMSNVKRGNSNLESRSSSYQATIVNYQNLQKDFR